MKTRIYIAETDKGKKFPVLDKTCKIDAIMEAEAMLKKEGQDHEHIIEVAPLEMPSKWDIIAPITSFILGVLLAWFIMYRFSSLFSSFLK